MDKRPTTTQTTRGNKADKTKIIIKPQQKHTTNTKQTNTYTYMRNKSNYNTTNNNNLLKHTKQQSNNIATTKNKTQQTAVSKYKTHKQKTQIFMGKRPTTTTQSTNKNNANTRSYSKHNKHKQPNQINQTHIYIFEKTKATTTIQPTSNLIKTSNKKTRTN